MGRRRRRREMMMKRRGDGGKNLLCGFLFHLLSSYLF